MPARTLLFRPDQRPVELEPDGWLRHPAGESDLLWVDLQSPSAAERQQLIEHFKIDPRAMEVASGASRRAVVRAYRDHYLVTALAIVTHEHQDNPRLTVIEVESIVGRNYLISLHTGPLPFAEAVEERTVTNPYLGRFDASYLLYVVLDTLVGHYAREFDDVEDKVERLEEEMLRDPGRRGLDQATVMKRHILGLRRLIAPHREAFGILVAADIPMIQEEHDETYFRDLLLHLDSFLERLDHARDVLTGAYDLYIANTGHRTDQQLKVLTYLSSVLLPMTVVTGIFGTNFALVEYRSWQPFYVMLVGMGLLAAGMLAFFRWRGWL